ncbi:MAG: galactokinase [Desulfobacterales bacterium]|nr:galactokinase [Desulfobacterales bacterium]MBF0396981.1 galactokinase [Desulfobacterales bacterium]
MSLKKVFENEEIEASAPCRIDMGGTIDISTFYYYLKDLNPCTFNIALDLRTTVSIHPYKKGMVKVSSIGFESTEFPLKSVPFDHPLGLIFAVCSYFQISGVHINIKSLSPPRSGLGGSSVAAVALISAFFKALSKIYFSYPSKEKIALMAYNLESSVAGVPCGIQDQLAAVYGGVNAWYFLGEMDEPMFYRKSIGKKQMAAALEKRIIVAYCGIPHESKDINGTWVRQFKEGKNRDIWIDIVKLTIEFVESLAQKDFQSAANAMNKETALRRKMTPDVFYPIGEELVESAIKNNCGARFTGAGGGGCLWALGEPESINKLNTVWENILSKEKDAFILKTKIDLDGVK